jgi:hypothetical protein
MLMHNLNQKRLDTATEIKRLAHCIKAQIFFCVEQRIEYKSL